MNSMQRGAREANDESDRLAHARVLGDAAGKLLAALNSLPTESDVRRIVREELLRSAQACGCREGECESKTDKRCRMADEVKQGSGV